MVTARATAIACGLSIVFVGSVLAQGSIEPTGPLVGAVTADSARIWVHAAEGAKVEVRYGLADAEPAARVAFEPIEKPDAAIPGRAALATLTGLKVATAYRFAVSVDGKTSPELAGSFRTAPVGPARFRVGVTSCMKIGQPQASWRLFLSQQPDLHLTLGDTHYADTTDLSSPVATPPALPSRAGLRPRAPAQQEGRVAHLHLRAPPALRRPARAQALGRAVFLGRHPPVAGLGAPRVRAGRFRWWR